MRRAGTQLLDALQLATAIVREHDGEPDDAAGLRIQHIVRTAQRTLDEAVRDYVEAATARYRRGRREAPELPLGDALLNVVPPPVLDHLLALRRQRRASD